MLHIIKDIIKAEPFDAYQHSGYRQVDLHETSMNSPRLSSVNLQLLALSCE